jgi:ribosomal protein S18 acetylase RimI-like enzyme
MLNDDIAISMLEGCDDATISGLIALLSDAIDDGASVGFVTPLDKHAADTYFRRALTDVAGGSKVMWIAKDAIGIVATVQLALAMQPNGSHRAEVQRLLVHRRARRRGLGTALMRVLEGEAAATGRTLLVLNTRAGDPPERLYRSLGYQVVGVIPRFARNPDGTLNDTTIMFKEL